MFQPHSFLWNYLWAAPNVLLLVLAYLMWRRGYHRDFPAFFAFALLGSIMELTEYAADVVPSVTPETYWRIVWATLLVVGLLKFVVIAEIFSHLFRSYTSVARLGTFLVRGVGIVLVFGAVLIAAHTSPSSRFGIISGAHILEQTIFIVELGLLALVFSFSAYFSLKLSRPILGITLGLAISACVHLAGWALIASGEFSNSKRVPIDFMRMTSYHACVLIWFYYILVPQKVANTAVTADPRVPLPENNLALWNRELERLLHQ